MGAFLKTLAFFETRATMLSETPGAHILGTLENSKFLKN